MASRPVSAPKSSTGAPWQEKPSSARARDELGDEARLADAGIAADDDDAAALTLQARFGDGAEFAQLFVATDQRRRRGGRRLDAANAPGDERLVLALQRHRRGRLGVEGIGHLLPRRRADDDLVEAAALRKRAAVLTASPVSA